MRYRKGTIAVNPTHDEAILRWVLQSKFISNEQLWRFLELDGHRLPRRSFNWRLQRMLQHGLLRQCEIPIVARATVYAIDGLGVAYLMGRGEYCVGTAEQLQRGNDGTAVLHALDLNEIRLALQETGALIGWKSDAEIRSQNEFTTFGYAKDYDAVIKVNVKGRESEFALEYERTPKAAKKYVHIRQAVESETRVSHFLYLAVNYHVLNFVTQFFERSRKRVYFGLFDDFRREQLDMKVIDGTRMRSDVLKAVLGNGVHS